FANVSPGVVVIRGRGRDVGVNGRGLAATMSSRRVRGDDEAEALPATARAASEAEPRVATQAAVGAALADRFFRVEWSAGASERGAPARREALLRVRGARDVQVPLRRNGDAVPDRARKANGQRRARRDARAPGGRRAPVGPLGALALAPIEGTTMRHKVLIALMALALAGCATTAPSDIRVNSAGGQ